MDFNRCFEKHDFNELNNLDIYILNNAVLQFIKLYNNNNNNIIFDVGANAGSFIKVLNHYNLINNIHCFEPHPVLSNKTKEIYPFIKMNNYCLSNMIGTIDINIPMWSVGLSSIINRPIFDKLKNEGQHITKINVKCETLDYYCKQNNIEEIDFIKIDVEGAEKMIFEGSTEMLKNKKIKCGLFEIGETLKDAGTNEKEICELLKGYGYNIDKTVSNNDYFFYK